MKVVPVDATHGPKHVGGIFRNNKLLFTVIIIM